MATYAIKEGYVYLTNSSNISSTSIETDSNTVCVEMRAKVLKQTISKMNITIPIPSLQLTDEMKQYIIDLRRGKEQIIINGYIADDPETLRDKIGQTPAGHSVYWKKHALRYLAGYALHPDGNTAHKGTIYIVWGSYNSNTSKNRRQMYTGAISKLEISETTTAIQGTFKAGESNEAITGRLRKLDVGVTIDLGENR